MSKNVIGPQNPEDQKTVKFDCFIPTLSQDSVTLITSTYEEAEAWGAIPVLQETINESLNIDFKEV